MEAAVRILEEVDGESLANGNASNTSQFQVDTSDPNVSASEEFQQKEQSIVLDALDPKTPKSQTATAPAFDFSDAPEF